MNPTDPKLLLLKQEHEKALRQKQAEIGHFQAEAQAARAQLQAANAHAHKIADERDAARDDLALRTREVEILWAEFVDLAGEYFGALAHFETDGDRAGWYDSGALRSAQYLGDLLTDLGKFERHPDGVGRRWWYRPKQEEPTMADEPKTTDEQPTAEEQPKAEPTPGQPDPATAIAAAKAYLTKWTETLHPECEGSECAVCENRKKAREVVAKASE